MKENRIPIEIIVITSATSDAYGPSTAPSELADIEKLVQEKGVVQKTPPEPRAR